MFKLIKLKTQNHFIFRDFEIDFCPEDEVDSIYYTSLIIGSNGTGKSNLIKTICEIFNFLSSRKVKIKYSFEIKYKFKHVFLIKYTLESNTYNITRNGIDKIELQDISFPKTIISSSYIFNDIYDLSYSAIDYSYLGIKSTSNNVFIKNPTKDLFSNFFYTLTNKENKVNNYKVVNSLFDKLNFEKQLTVNYKIGNNKSVLNSLDLTENESGSGKIIFETNTKVFRDFYGGKTKSRKYREAAIVRIIENKEKQRQTLFRYLLKYTSVLNSIKSKKKDELISFNFNWKKAAANRQKNNEFKDHLEAFKILQDLEIVEFSNFEITKNINIDFNYVSSGEYHIIHTLINILSKIKQDSLVLIDEPEISLHPKWQIEYFSLLESIIKGFSTAHFIVASHSHFLVSDLNKNNSSIIILEKIKNGISAFLREKELNTYGWSSEQILFEVFKVPTVRNAYISNIVVESINILSKSKPSNADVTKLSRNIEKLKEVRTNIDFKVDDPILPIIKEIIKD